MAQTHLLKQCIISDSHLSPSATTPSSFTAVMALAWASLVCAKHAAGVIASPDDEVYLFFFADLRGHLDPLPGDGYFGMCISGCLATAAARELLMVDGVARAVAAVGAKVRHMAEEPVDMYRLMNVAGSTRFAAY
jgi:hypothetical protein